MNFTKCLLMLATTLLLSGFVKAAGEVDTSFNANLATSPTGSIKRVFVQPDGKILIGGNFQSIDGKWYSHIARLNADGSIDTTFTPPRLFKTVSGFETSDVNVYAIAMQSDGKIIIGGDFALGIRNNGAMRLNPNGTIDATFATGINAGAVVTDIKVFADNKFMLGGNYMNGTKRNLDGSIDFSSQINFATANSRAFSIQPDGSVIAAHQNMIRYDSAGNFDTSFLVTSNIIDGFSDLISLPDGKILACGTFTQINGFAMKGIIRINPNGTIDPTFVGNTNGANGSVLGMSIRPDGKILIAGEFTSYSGVSRNKVALLNADGSLDTSFNYSPNGFVKANAVAQLANGNILVGGDAVFTTQQPLAITQSNGTFISAQSFSNLNRGYSLAVQPDGKIIVGGRYNMADNVIRKSISRFNPNGTLDSSFAYSNTQSDFSINAVSIQSDGRILLGGANISGLRLTPTGVVDGSISQASIRDIKIKSDGKIIYAGDGFIYQFNPDLTSDSTFTPTVRFGFNVYTVAVQPDGKILIGGDFTGGRIARLNADGTLDTTFNPLGGANAYINEIVLQPDGKILAGGGFNSFSFNSNYKSIVRLNSNGSLDTSFTTNLLGAVNAIAVQPNGKILIGGRFIFISDGVFPGVARLRSNGTIDRTFNIGTGTNGIVWDIKLQSDGKILYTGEFSNTNGHSTLGIGRLLNDNINSLNTAPFDFDGDGRTDMSVFRPSNRFWYGIESRNYFLPIDPVIFQHNFGAVGDVLAPADYNFDGKCDIAIFRPANGQWWYQAPNGQHTLAAVWGQTGDKPIPSDFDGDGKTDFIVYRPSNGVWYRLSSETGQMSFVQFGIAEDIPLQADFDGDGKSDLAVYRPSSGTWYWLNSSNGQFAGVPFGTVGDKPYTGDFDGDGKTDLAVFRPSNNYWYFLYSGSGYSFGAIPFGTNGDIPVVGDYDGDGKSDLGIFRPSNANWFIQSSTQGSFGGPFGLNGDIPIPSAYYP